MDLGGSDPPRHEEVPHELHFDEQETQVNIKGMTGEGMDDMLPTNDNGIVGDGKS